MSLFETIEFETGIGNKATIRITPSPSGSLLVWPVDPTTAVAARETLYRAAVERGTQLGCNIAQILLPDDFANHGDSLERVGFRRLTSIVHMRCNFAEIADQRKPESRNRVADIDWLDCTSGNHELLASVLFDTYPGSLDLPEIHDWRTPDEVLEGHRAQGTEGFHDWSTMNCDGEPAGVLMLAADRETAELEIAYLGLKPQFRGRGLGNELMSRIAKRRVECSPWNCKTVVVNLDRRNSPALNLYARWNLQSVAEHSLHIARIKPRSDS